MAPRLEVLRAGPEPADAGRPVLVFVHGGYHGAWSWEKFLPFFAALGYPCRAVSLRGHGGSEGRSELNRAGFADFDADVESVLAELPDRPVIVGHSLGGLVVQRAVARDPGRFRAMVLLASSPPTGLSVRQGLSWFRAGVTPVLRLAQLHGGRLEPGGERFPYGCFFAGDLPAEELRSYGRRMQPESVKVGLQSSRRVVGRIPAERPPVLVVNGEQDWFCPPEFAERTAAAWGTGLVRVPGSGHDVMLDAQWESAARAVADFLDPL